MIILAQLSRISLKRLQLILIFILIPTLNWAQYEVKGKYIDINGNGIPSANVLLLKSSDSTLIKGFITDLSGIFVLATNKPDSCIVAITYIGYEDYFSETFVLNGRNSRIELGEITATEKSTELDEVVVEAEKPLFEQRIDRTVVNVQSYISASGGTALDVLARSPGVTVDRMNNVISLAGKQGVRIMINGKMSQMPLDAAVEMLAGMNAENIEKIELITTPPAKYEAEGDAGLINIVMKRETEAGTNGNISVYGGYGEKERYGGSINFDSRGKKITFYGDYAYRMDVVEQDILIDRVVNIDGQEIHTHTQNDRNAFTRVHDGRIGVEWMVGEHTTIGGLFSIFDRLWDMDALAQTNESTSGSPSGYTEMSTFEINEWTLLIGNLNLTHNFNERYNISMDIDYIDYTAYNPTDYHQIFYNLKRQIIDENTLLSRKDTPIETWVSKVDFTGTINDVFTIEAGAKASLSSLKNNIAVQNFQDGQYVTDLGLTSDAEMIENIGAGYASVNIQATQKIELMLGIRYEQTRTNIDTKREQNIVDRNFGSWFPSVFFQNKINKENSWILSYSRRITRPSFFQIAPFVIFLDPNSFWGGNISLLPSMTDAVKAEYNYKMVILSLNYSYDKNSISLFQPKIIDGKQVSTAENLEYMRSYSINLSFPIQITDWWEWQFNLTGNHSEIRAEFLDDPITLSVKNFNFNASQKFSLPKNFTVEVSGFYQSEQLFGIARMKPFGSLDFGVEKKFENSSIRLAYNDILKTQNWDFRTYIPEENLNIRTHVDFDNSVIRLTYSTTFGNKKLKVNKRETTGSEEEQRRFE